MPQLPHGNAGTLWQCVNPFFILFVDDETEMGVEALWRAARPVAGVDDCGVLNFHKTIKYDDRLIQILKMHFLLFKPR